MFKSVLKYVQNKDPKFGSNSNYHAAWVKDEFGNDVPLMLTERELRKAVDRANDNLEDLPPCGVVGRLTEWFNNLD